MLGEAIRAIVFVRVLSEIKPTRRYWFAENLETVFAAIPPRVRILRVAPFAEVFVRRLVLPNQHDVERRKRKDKHKPKQSDYATKQSRSRRSQRTSYRLSVHRLPRRWIHLVVSLVNLHQNAQHATTHDETAP